MSNLHSVYAEVFHEVYGDAWKVLNDNTEAEAYDKTKMISP